MSKEDKRALQKQLNAWDNQMPKSCPNCNTSVKIEDKFCGECWMPVRGLLRPFNRSGKCNYYMLEKRQGYPPRAS